ncbi:MAG: hypothetical protein ACI4DY_13305 [Monoglobaceae bacterium]
MRLCFSSPERRKRAIIITIAALAAIVIAILLTLENNKNSLEPAVPPEVDMGGLKKVEVIKPKVSYTWTEADAIALAQTAWGEARGCSTVEQAAVMWCVLNRCDAMGGSPVYQCGKPGQFHAYSTFNPVTDELYSLAVDVLNRWEHEKALIASVVNPDYDIVAESVGRVLPKDYLWFSGDGDHNYFRNAYEGGDTWGWTLPNVYESAAE